MSTGARFASRNSNENENVMQALLFHCYRFVMKAQAHDSLINLIFNLIKKK